MDRKEYLRKYQREWARKRRAAFFDGKSCVQCCSTEKLELDHIDPSKKVDHKIWTWSEERRSAEIAKCQILCRKCHWAKTCEQRGYGIVKHGTSHAYRKYKCRCRPCVSAEYAEHKAYRQRRALREAAETSARLKDTALDVSA